MVNNNYNWRASVTDMIKQLDWVPLETRRKTARLAIFHKAMGGHLALPVQSYLQPVQRITRRSQENSFIQPQVRINTYKFSYIPRTTTDWNDLPASLTTIVEPDQFKTALKTHFKEKLNKLNNQNNSD